MDMVKNLSKYLIIAMVLNWTYLLASDEFYSYDIQYLVDSEGETWHVAWYSNGDIGTLVSGKDAGLQLIYIQDELIHYTTTNIKDVKKFTHVYPWGKVISTDKKQRVMVN